ncbi:unnamed protein product [Vitrella brassicaformis CCMP3155]|uniref:Uncharacterized protein n=1 Tax=Vitrella brassicaformis (strain CCMP3155) TaxID=1169540 RepID=A0A0G4F1F2_VITBC|nr:unnamed protein product [Vitrella brassicaformis CCMP3155]|eukprot:CEM05727.1 unnamed protein product [Vitrella brassicaformis CCMP3155]
MPSQERWTRTNRRTMASSQSPSSQHVLTAPVTFNVNVAKQTPLKQGDAVVVLIGDKTLTMACSGQPVWSLTVAVPLGEHSYTYAIMGSTQAAASSGPSATAAE